MLRIQLNNYDPGQVREDLKGYLLDECRYITMFADHLTMKCNKDELIVNLPDDGIWGDILSYPTNVAIALSRLKEKYKNISVDGGCTVTDYDSGCSYSGVYHSSKEDTEVAFEEAYICIACGKLIPVSQEVILKSEEEGTCICSRLCTEKLIEGDVYISDIHGLISENFAEDISEGLEEEETIKAFKEKLSDLINE